MDLEARVSRAWWFVGTSAALLILAHVVFLFLSVVPMSFFEAARLGLFLGLGLSVGQLIAFRRAREWARGRKRMELEARIGSAWWSVATSAVFLLFTLAVCLLFLKLSSFATSLFVLVFIFDAALNVGQLLAFRRAREWVSSAHR